MKLENDPVNFHPIPPRKSYNPFDSDDDALDSPSLKPGNMYLKESGNDFDLKAFEKSSDTVIFHMDNGDFLWEESVLGQPTATADHSTNPDGSYTDKNVTECELPEFVICYKESNIKDIGIDEGVASHEKLWAQSGDDEDKTNDVSVLDAPKSTQKATPDELNEEALTGQYLVHEFVDDDLLKITELNLDIEDRASPGDQTTTVETASSAEKETDKTAAESEILVENEITPKEEAGDTHDANKLSYNSKVESKSITFNFRSSANSKPEKQEDEPQKTEAATPPSAQTMTRQEEGGASSSSILARPEGRVHGESSFSAGMPVPLPSSIIFSEPLTYSGSISLRSESSAGTTSTRSFAFPVLQTDWNSSPTRMGKGQRHTKKHRGWKALSCCKF